MQSSCCELTDKFNLNKSVLTGNVFEAFPVCLLNYYLGG